MFLPGESKWTEESDRIQSMGSQRDMTEGLSTHMVVVGDGESFIKAMINLHGSQPGKDLQQK